MISQEKLRTIIDQIIKLQEEGQREREAAARQAALEREKRLEEIRRKAEREHKRALDAQRAKDEAFARQLAGLSSSPPQAKGSSGEKPAERNRAEIERKAKFEDIRREAEEAYRRKRELQEARDAELARQLAGSPSFLPQAVRRAPLSQPALRHWEGISAAERGKIEKELGEILASPAVAGEYGSDAAPAVLTDAHKYTRTVIRAGIPVLTRIDDQFKLSSAEMTPEQVKKSILDFLGVSSGRNVSGISAENINATFSHIAKNAAVDSAETHANVHHLLSRTYTLAQKMDKELPQDQRVFVASLATILDNNIGDGGSCIPGLVARLYPLYAKMISRELGVGSIARARLAI